MGQKLSRKYIPLLIFTFAFLSLLTGCSTDGEARSTEHYKSLSNSSDHGGAPPPESKEESAESPNQEVPESPEEIVVLVHGLGRTEASLLAMQVYLQQEGFEVFNWGYSSVCCTLEEISRSFADELEEIIAAEPDFIHFVGHSMGNIIIRWYLHHHLPQQRMGRVVMLAPPNQGSHTADRYVEWFDWAIPPLEDLQTEHSLAISLPSIDGYEAGVIAGEYDGKVEVEETKGIGERDHRVVSAAHTFIMNRPDVLQLTVEFLRTGSFGED